MSKPKRLLCHCRSKVLAPEMHMLVMPLQGIYGAGLPPMEQHSETCCLLLPPPESLSKEAAQDLLDRFDDDGFERIMPKRRNHAPH